MGKDGADYAPNDYFGGDLKGIADKLDYLKGLGVSCIYLNPIFEADSNHRYNTADYRTIDPLLGTERDFITLVQQAGERGIRLILDGVFSHTGADSIYFNRNGSYHTVGAYQGSASPYYSWYSFKGSRDEYDCWWGFKTLPNVNEMDQGYRSFICGEEGVLAKWQRLGAGGWRLDVADELPDEFIKELNAAVKRNDADAMVLGEVWEDCSNKCGPQGRRAYVNGGVLDGAMNYPFRRAVLDYLCGKTDAYGCNNALQTLASNYPRRFLRGCINLLGSHDEIRPLSYLGTDGDLEGLSRAEQAKVKLDEKALSLGKKRLLCAMALMLVAEGVPCIYYGDEVGMEGLKDPFNRRTFPWGGGDGELYSSIAKLTAIRSGSLALKQGYTRMGALNKSVFCIIRFLNDEVVVAVFNNSSAPKRVIVQPSLLFEGEDAQRPLSLCGLYDDVFGGTVAAESIMELEVEANGFKVLRKKA